jgi:hypothetical protein
MTVLRIALDSYILSDTCNLLFLLISSSSFSIKQYRVSAELLYPIIKIGK